MVGNLKNNNLYYLFWVPFFLTFCTKKSVSDPILSLRTRDSRIVGKWEIIQYYYYDGRKSGVAGTGDPVRIFYSLSKNGDWIICDSTFKPVRQLGYWNWIFSNSNKTKQTKLLFGFQKYSYDGGYIHLLERLTYKEVRTRFYFDVSDEKRYMIYEWKRQE